MDNVLVSLIDNIPITDYQLAERLLEIYFVDGSFYYRGKVNVSQKKYAHIKKPISLEMVLNHVQSRISLLAPSVHSRRVKWIAIDFDYEDTTVIAEAHNLTCPPKTSPDIISQ